MADRAVLQLATSLREAELIATAERLERAYDHEVRIVALDIPDREAILRVLEGCPEELAELRANALTRARLAAAGGSLVTLALTRCDDLSSALSRSTWGAHPFVLLEGE